MKSASTERMGSASVFEEIDRLKSENRRLQTLYATSLALTAQTQKDDEKTNRLLPSAAPLFQTICSNLNSSATNKARLRARQNQSKAKSDFQRRFAPRNNRHAGFSNADTTWQNPCRRRNRISENVFDQNSLQKHRPLPKRQSNLASIARTSTNCSRNLEFLIKAFGAKYGGAFEVARSRAIWHQQ